MTASPAAPSRRAEPMLGPDFVMEKVVRWAEHPGADSELALADGSRWRVDPKRGDYAALASFIDYAWTSGNVLLVSGDRSRGELERVGQARALAVQSVGDEPDADGRVVVLFHGPPAVYRVRLSRPGAAHDLALLRHSVASGAFFDSPDLLVGTDIRASEVVAVRPLAARAK